MLPQVMYYSLYALGCLYPRACISLLAQSYIAAMHEMTIPVSIPQKAGNQENHKKYRRRC